jgi:hypothetical protein
LSSSLSVSEIVTLAGRLDAGGGAGDEVGVFAQARVVNGRAASVVGVGQAGCGAVRETLTGADGGGSGTGEGEDGE